MEKIFNGISITFGIIGGVMANVLGGNDKILHALAVLVVVDFITGICKGYGLKKLDSKTMFIGIIRKVLIFVVVAVAVEMENILGNTIPLREIVIMFYLANEGISFLENVSNFLPLPEKLKDVFTQMQEKEDNKEEGKKHGN